MTSWGGREESSCLLPLCRLEHGPDRFVIHNGSEVYCQNAALSVMPLLNEIASRAPFSFGPPCVCDDRNKRKRIWGLS